MRLGVIADPHVSLEQPDAEAAWHNPFLLADAHDRLREALAHPFVADADLVALLGDLSHFGDRASIQCVVDAVADTGKPAVVLSGNHDVLTAGVRLEPAPDPRPPDGIGLVVHDVVALTDRGPQPFDVTSRVVSTGSPTLVLTHFPLLTLEGRAREASLLYSGHLDQLAPSPGPLPPDGPMVVCSGHLHLRGVTAEGRVLQLAFAALVEPPYEVATVDITADRVSYECASIRPSGTAHLPVLDPPSGTWAWDGTAWTSVDEIGEAEKRIAVAGQPGPRP